MVLAEILEIVLGFVAEHLGVEGVAIGMVATASVGLYYLREAASAFVLIARYARMVSIIGFVVLGLLVVGTATGVVDMSAGTALGDLVRLLPGLP